MHCLWVPGKLPGLNELIRAKAVSAGGHGSKGARWNAYGQLKKEVQQVIAYSAFAQKLKPIGSGYFTYLLKEQNRQRDPSNMLAGAMKLIEDSLIECKLLPNDGWSEVLGIAGHPVVDKKEPGVLLFVTQHRTLSADECVAFELFR